MNIVALAFLEANHDGAQRHINSPLETFIFLALIYSIQTLNDKKME